MNATSIHQSAELSKANGNNDLRLFLRIYPDELHFKSSSSDSKFINFTPTNLFLHNESIFPLQVDIYPGLYLCIVGSSLIKPSNGQDKQAYCRFLIQPVMLHM
jgi:hypothetical protein